MRNGDFDHPAYRFLDRVELDLLREWFRDTNEKRFIGEMSIATASLLYGLLTGSRIRRVVELGHYAGYSTLLLGFLLRRYGGRIWSVDIDKHVSDYAGRWIKKAGLGETVRLSVGNSWDKHAPGHAADWLGGTPGLVLIDSSHQFMATYEELSLWHKVLEVGGFFVLHDSSEMAEEYDTTRMGGVRRALARWVEETGLPSVSINEKGQLNVFQDPCGCAIIQKI